MGCAGIEPRAGANLVMIYGADCAFCVEGWGKAGFIDHLSLDH